jgi:23S rRNA (cytosine1962-C5)-methyltransferase
MILEELSTLDDYELLDSGDGLRLERFGKYVLSRPDPAVLWKKRLPESEWEKADAAFTRNEEDRGEWENKNVPEKWTMQYAKGTDHELSFFAKLTPFKHTGVFPEQSANWDFITEKLKARKEKPEKLRFLNLFGYTGIASVLAAKMGCEVTHVDASKPSMDWARENMLESGLPEDAIRWILDDCLKFVKREVKRGKKYDAIILDPPAFGRGAKGEVWKFNEDLPELLESIKEILSDEFSFVIINAYAVSVSSLLLKNLFIDLDGKRSIDYGELVIKEKSGKLLSTGIFARLY